MYFCNIINVFIEFWWWLLLLLLRNPNKGEHKPNEIVQLTYYACIYPFCIMFFFTLLPISFRWSNLYNVEIRIERWMPICPLLKTNSTATKKCIGKSVNKKLFLFEWREKSDASLCQLLMSTKYQMWKLSFAMWKKAFLVLFFQLVQWRL